MKSAFGVDHGEISKALPGFNSARRAMNFGRVVSASAKAGRQGRKDMKAGKTASNAARAARIQENAETLRNAGAKVKSAPKGFVNKPISISGVGSGVASGVGAVGRGTASALNKYPGATGTAVLGAGGYGIYRAGKSGEKRKKRA